MSTPVVDRRMADSAGDVLREWRQRRRLSQLELSLEAGVSTRHLSFVETGRSRASRELLRHLAIRLDMPLRERNRLLLAAGYAPEHPDRPFGHSDMAAVRHAIDVILRGLEPYPALVVDRLWNLLTANQAAGLLTEGIDPALLQPPVNVLRVAFHPRGLPSISNSSGAANAAFVAQIRRKARHAHDEELNGVLDEIEQYLPALDPLGAPADGPQAGAFELRTRMGPVRLCTVIATLGAPIEVTSSDLAVESFLPADDESASLLRQLAADRSR